MGHKKLLECRSWNVCRVFQRVQPVLGTNSEGDKIYTVETFPNHQKPDWLRFRLTPAGAAILEACDCILSDSPQENLTTRVLRPTEIASVDWHEKGLVWSNVG